METTPLRSETRRARRVGTNMALENVIVLSEPLAPDEFWDIVTKEFGLEKSSDFLSGKPIGVTEGMMIWVSKSSDLQKEIVKERFDIDPKLSLRCRIDSFEFLAQGREAQLNLVFFLL